MMQSSLRRVGAEEPSQGYSIGMGDLRGGGGPDPSAPTIDSIPTATVVSSGMAQPFQQPHHAQQVYYGQQVQYGEQQQVIYPGQPQQVIIVQQHPGSQNQGQIALVCFILGWFFFFPWFGCYCADGGLCTENKTAKCWNILSLTMLSIYIFAIVVFFSVVIGLSASGGNKGCAYDKCSCDPAACETCLQCTDRGYTFCSDMLLSTPSSSSGGANSGPPGKVPPRGRFCTVDTPQLAVQSKSGNQGANDLACFAKNHGLCYGGLIGAMMTGMLGSNCQSWERINRDMGSGSPQSTGRDGSAAMSINAAVLCVAEQGSHGSGGSGSGSGSGFLPIPADMSYPAGGNSSFNATKSAINETCYKAVVALPGASGIGRCNDVYCDTCALPADKTSSGNYCLSCVKGYEIDVLHLKDCTGECVKRGEASAKYVNSSCTIKPGAQCSYEAMRTASS